MCWFGIKLYARNSIATKKNQLLIFVYNINCTINKYIYIHCNWYSMYTIFIQWLKTNWLPCMNNVLLVIDMIKAIWACYTASIKSHAGSHYIIDQTLICQYWLATTNNSKWDVHYSICIEKRCCNMQPLTISVVKNKIFWIHSNTIIRLTHSGIYKNMSYINFTQITGIIHVTMVTVRTVFDF